MMTPEKLRRIISVAKALEKQSIRADEYDLQLQNGSTVGALLSSMAADLRVIAELEEAKHALCKKTA